MKFLEAQAILADFRGNESLPIVLAMSGMPGALPLFLRAEAARRGRSAVIDTLPFNTLQQRLLTPGASPELMLLMPWDLAPALDWRSGIPSNGITADTVMELALSVTGKIQARITGADHLFYLPAPSPPIFRHDADDVRVQAELARLALRLGAHVLSPGAFSLRNYLVSGAPIDNEHLGELAEIMVGEWLRPTGGYKVLVTDLDNVMWHGVIGEDGIDGIHFRPDGLGFAHFIYQSFLARLRRDGVLLAAVSRNDADLARAPFQGGQMMLREDDLVALLASYQTKSSQIEALADQLGLGLDAFVFVDDNPVELAEVSTRLPAVRCVPFPGRSDDLPALLRQLSRLFAREHVTAEDSQRTGLYRTRLAGMVPSAGAGTDLSEFLRDLRMTLTIEDRSHGDRTRAVQLINKTNQFNLNGRRFTDQEIAAILDAGGRLYVARLDDRHGSHGEILACLVDATRTVLALVMSCRVLQRRVEHAFLAWLAARGEPPSTFAFVETERNEPLRQSLVPPYFARSEYGMSFDAKGFSAAYADTLALFEIVTAP